MNSKKKAIAVTLIIIMSIVLNSSVLFAESNEASEELHIMDKYPGILWNDMTLLPMRPFLEGLGLNVEWYEKTKLIAVSGRIEKFAVNEENVDEETNQVDETKYKEYSFMLQINNKYAMVGQKEVFSKVPPVIYKGQTYVPCKFIAEEMGAKVNWAGKGDVYITLPGTPNKSFVFPINTKPDLSQLPVLPKPKILEPTSAWGGIPKADLDLLKSKAGNVFEDLFSDSDVAFRLVDDPEASYMEVFLPLTKENCKGLSNTNANESEIRAKQLVNIRMKNIGELVWRNWRGMEEDALKTGLWEKYNSEIDITVVNARKDMLTIAIPLKPVKFDKATFGVDATVYFPYTDGSDSVSMGHLAENYSVYINNKYIGKGITNWDEDYSDEIINFFKYPVTKPISPYFDVVNYPYNIDFDVQGIR